MKTVKEMTLVLAVLMLTATVAFGDSAAKTASKEKGIIGKIADDMAESTRTVHEINKENIAAVKAETRANFDEATAPTPALVRFREAKGFGNKIKVIVESIVEGARENTKKEEVRRAEIQSHESYRALLENQRANRQEIQGNGFFDD